MTILSWFDEYSLGEGSGSVEGDSGWRILGV